MAEKEKFEEKEYIVPLRRKFIKTPKYRRVPKAIKALKKFIARHLKLYDKDFSKIKIDKYLNEEMWFRGIKKPPHKIKVKVKKEQDKIIVELAEIPEALKFKKLREEKIKEEKEKKKVEEKVEEKKEEEKKIEEAEEEIKEKEEEKEKEKATVEAGLKEAEMKAREIKHKVVQEKKPKHAFRKALQK